MSSRRQHSSESGDEFATVSQSDSIYMTRHRRPRSVHRDYCCGGPFDTGVLAKFRIRCDLVEPSNRGKPE